jgi:soluble lytic murein transglycosylase-like protein
MLLSSLLIASLIVLESNRDMPNPRVVMYLGKMYKFAEGTDDATIAAHLKTLKAKESEFPILTKGVEQEVVPRVYEQSFDEFRLQAVAGKLNPATGTKLEGEAEAKTSLALGEINKYPDEDIAHFYARRWGYKAPGDRFRPAEEALAKGYKNLIEDAVEEGRITKEKAGALLATVTIAGAAGAGPLSKKKVTIDELRPVSELVSRSTGIPSAVLMAKAETESSLRPWITSKQGAFGLFQMKPEFAKHYGDPTGGRDWRKQAQASGAMLMDLKKEFKTWPRAWAAYNWGETNLRAHLKKGGKLSDKSVPSETRKHVAKMIIATKKHGYDPIKEQPIQGGAGDDGRTFNNPD